jgi:hypothetical protein
MRYITGILIAIGLVVLTIILIVKALSGGGGGSSNAPTQIDLNSYASTSAVMQMTIDGPVNADKTHNQIRVTVGRDETTLDILKGYRGNVVSTKTFANNQAAYTQFLHSLNVAGFTKGNIDPNVRDERGYCPTGERFIFEAISGGQDVMRWWKTSCNQGNFRGQSDVIRALFKAQVPNYNLLTVKAQLY